MVYANGVGRGLGWLRAMMVLMVLGCCSGAAMAADEATEFQGRSLYPTVKWIELEQLAKMRPNVIIVDARSNYEYDTLHIKEAINVPLGDKGFVDAVQKLRKESPHPIVFYCNGRTCMKSYQAALKAQDAGIANVFAYDAGIFDWAKAYPADSVLLGKSPVDPALLISSAQLKAHSLSPADFEKRIGDSAIVLDVRDRFQQEATTLFPLVQHSVPLDNASLKKYVELAKQQGKTLLIYDEAGHQVRWLQYYLEDQKVSSYYFMAGGAKGYFDSMVGALVRESAKQ